MCIVDRIRQLAKEKGHSLTTLEKTLGIGNGTIGKWKSQSPSCDKIILIADYLQTSIDYILTGNENDLSNDEIELLKHFNSIDENARGRILERAKTLAELAEEKKPPANESSEPKSYFPPLRHMRDEDIPDIPFVVTGIYLEEYDMPVSAGDGIYIEYVQSEPILVTPTPEATRANYILRVKGDSMQPFYFNGDKVLVQTKGWVEEGEIGIFQLNNFAFIKRMGNGELISLNPKHKPIKIRDYDSFYCKGKVLGIAHEVKPDNN